MVERENVSDLVYDVESVGIEGQADRAKRKGGGSVKLDPNSPAYPVECDYVDGVPRGRQTASRAGYETGLTVRQEFAKHMMGNLLVGVDKPNMQVCASLAVEAADALIAQLNKETA